jgi:hypothetical protein
MKISSIYLDDFIKLYEEMFDKKVELDDNDGLYHFDEIGMVIKSWNYDIGFYVKYDTNVCKKLFKILLKCNEYWFENE